MKKRLFAALVIACAIGIGTPLLAAEESNQVSSSDTVAIQKSVKALASAFEVEVPQEKAPRTASAPPVTEKTIVNVLDKAIDKVSDVVGAMAKAIENVAPDVWRIMLKQQYAKAIADLVVPLVFAIILVIIWLCLRALRKRIRGIAPDVAFFEKDKNGKYTEEITFYGGVAVVMWVVGIIFALDALWLGNRLADSTLLLINPEFYAIKDLLRMILHKGM